jgi:hypothetical protein
MKCLRRAQRDVARLAERNRLLRLAERNRLLRLAERNRLLRLADVIGCSVSPT